MPEDTTAILSGNEAIALGVAHAGVRVARAYPGTPSTEILEAISRFEGVDAQWATNEKTAVEIATGASYAGARAFASMKHVGLNVAADPFFAVSMTGVRGGLVIVSADDPSMHSSQNEQDNRQYARFAKVPLLEPADSQECYELVRLAYDLSEQYDTPVLVRTTTRISHSKSVVRYRADARLQPRPLPRFPRDPAKLVMIPANARRRRPLLDQRLERLAALAETFPYNRVIPGSPDLGIIADSASYQYAREVFPEASFLKLTLVYPFPVGLIRKFAESVSRLVVIEELDPFIEETVRMLGIPVEGKSVFPGIGEFSPVVVRRSAEACGLIAEPGEPAPAPVAAGAVPIPARPPVLCPGCPHTAAFYALRRLGYQTRTVDQGDDITRRILGSLGRAGPVISGDIGCYTLGVLPPLLALDSTGCMGASIGNALGMEKAGLPQKSVAVIGDSTFLHSGITPLLDVVYNRGTTTTVILDNSTTAMTGHQEHAGTGKGLHGEDTPTVDIEAIVRAVGVKDVRVVDAFRLPDIEHAIHGALESEQASVVLVRGACILKTRGTNDTATVDPTRCDGCSGCLRTGCPAIGFQAGKATIDPVLCVGSKCAVCLDTCPQHAISLPAAVGAGAGAGGTRQ